MILAALLCHERLLSYTFGDTVRSINDCYLVDLDVLLNGKFLSNQRTIFERVEFLFLRVLPILSDKYENMIQLLAAALNKISPFLESFYGLTDQYVAERIKSRVPHLSARNEVKGLRLMETMLELSKDVVSPSQSISNISEGYWMVEFSGKSTEDTKPISASRTANFGKEFLGLSSGKASSMDATSNAITAGHSWWA